MAGANELIEFLMLLLIFGCAIGWIIIGIGILKCRINGRCPKGRICKNSECRWCAWCEKNQRYSDKIQYIFEIMREMEKREEAENADARKGVKT